MVVYIDVIFMLNLCIDAATLQATSWSRKLRAKQWRIWAAAAIGATYVVMMFFPTLSEGYTFIVKVLFSMLMVWTAFGYVSLQSYLRNLGAFYLVNFVAAGSIFAIHYLLQSRHAVFNGIMFSQSGGTLKIGLVFVAAVFVLAIGFYRTVIGSLRKTEQLKRFTAQMEVRIGESSVTCVGLIDTGNQLYEPLTRTPVAIMEAELWRGWLPGKLLNLIQSSDMNELLDAIGGDAKNVDSNGEDDRGDDAMFDEHRDDDAMFSWRDRLRLVPYKGINQGTAFLLALKPDEVIIRMQGDSTPYSSRKVLIGLQSAALSGEGAYRAIIHPDLVNGKHPNDNAKAG